MKIYILPKTPVGRLSVGLATFFILMCVISILTEYDGVGNRIAGFILASVNFISAVAAVVGLVLGLISVTGNRERSALVFLAIFIGLLPIAFFLGELLIPT